MEERNIQLEKDGLYWESKTHEWFKNDAVTEYANDNLSLGLASLIVRNKATGEYDFVLLDANKIIYDTKNIDDMYFHIDNLKIINKYKRK